MAGTRSAWGVLKARGMRGVDDRGEFYRFWYHSWEIERPETPLQGWWAMPLPESRLATMFQIGGNLVLTNRRLLWEPMTGGRAVSGDAKKAINIIARAQESISPRRPAAWQLGQVRLTEADRRNSVLLGGDDDGGPGRAFYFAQSSAFGGSRDERTDFVTRVLAGQRRVLDGES